MPAKPEAQPGPAERWTQIRGHSRSKRPPAQSGCSTNSHCARSGRERPHRVSPAHPAVPCQPAAGSHETWGRATRTASGGAVSAHRRPGRRSGLPELGVGVGRGLLSGRTKHSITKSDGWDSPGGLGVKILPANAGDPGSIPGLGRPHKPGSN